MRSNYDQKQINKSRINKYVLNTTPNFKMTPSISSQTRTENAESPMKDNLAKVKLKLQKCSTEETMPRWN